MDFKKSVVILFTLVLAVLLLNQFFVLFSFTGGASTVSGQAFLLIVPPSIHCGMIVTTDAVLSENITVSGDCINVGADDIILDGSGFKLTGDGTGRGIILNGYNNVTLKNFATVDNFSIGIYFNNTSNSTFYNISINSADNAAKGMSLDTNILNNNFSDINISLSGAGSIGLYLDSSSNNSFSSLEIDSVSGVEVWSTNNSFNNSFTSLLLEGNTNLDFSSMYALTIEVNNTPPAIPADLSALPYYLTFNNLSTNSIINFNLTYNYEDIADLVYESIFAYHYNDSAESWSILGNSEVYTDDNIISTGLINSFSTFGFFGVHATTTTSTAVHGGVARRFWYAHLAVLQEMVREHDLNFTTILKQEIVPEEIPGCPENICGETPVVQEKKPSRLAGIGTGLAFSTGLTTTGNIIVLVMILVLIAYLVYMIHYVKMARKPPALAGR